MVTTKPTCVLHESARITLHLLKINCVCTSVCMLGTDPVLPLAIAELELLGLLGPEPGALLQREETGGDT